MEGVGGLLVSTGQRVWGEGADEGLIGALTTTPDAPRLLRRAAGQAQKAGLALAATGEVDAGVTRRLVAPAPTCVVAANRTAVPPPPAQAGHPTPVGPLAPPKRIAVEQLQTTVRRLSGAVLATPCAEQTGVPACDVGRRRAPSPPQLDLQPVGQAVLPALGRAHTRWSPKTPLGPKPCGAANVAAAGSGAGLVPDRPERRDEPPVADRADNAATDHA